VSPAHSEAIWDFPPDPWWSRLVGWGSIIVACCLDTIFLYPLSISAYMQVCQYLCIINQSVLLPGGVHRELRPPLLEFSLHSFLCSHLPLFSSSCLQLLMNCRLCRNL
jgi:hypothetical protein